MKVLLHNEASGVHVNLRDGLRALGHEAILLVTSGALAQGRTADVVTGTSRAGLIGRIARHTVPLYTFRRFLEFDVINFVMGISLLPGREIRYMDIPMLKSKGALLSYYGVGCDEVALLRIRSDSTSLPCCDSCLKIDSLGAQCEKINLQMRTRASAFADCFDFSISPSYVYSHSHSFFPKAAHAAIPFPINLKRFSFAPATPKSKPIIVHSPTRRGFKGTEKVLQAIQLLRERRDDFEFRLVENLSHMQYIEAMRDCDIYIDQLLSGDAYGMAALENLAHGKIVISGNGPKNWEEFPFAEGAPIIPASPDSLKVAETLSMLLDNKSHFLDYADQGRKFVSDFHDHVKVSERFVDLWSGRTLVQ